MKISRIKSLIPAPADAEIFFINTTVDEVEASEYGVPTSPGEKITLTQWKRVGKNPAALSSEYYFGLQRVSNGVATNWGNATKTNTIQLLGRDFEGYTAIRAYLMDDNQHEVASRTIRVNKRGETGGEGPTGPTGPTGPGGVTYEMRLSAYTVTKHSDNSLTPSTINIKNYRRQGDGGVTAYVGFMIIEDANNNVLFANYDDDYTLTLTSSMTFPLNFKMWDAEANSSGTPLAEAYVYTVSDGEKGNTGPMFYLAGEYSSTKTYTRTDYICPVVLSGGYYYYLKEATNRVNDNAYAPGNTTYWGLADQFKMIFTDALFAAFAKLGSFVVSGDYFISQFGTLYNGSTAIPVGNSNYDATYGEKVPYAYFSDQDPMVDTLPSSGDYKFRPALALNARTGVTYQNKSYVRGVLRTEAIYTVKGEIVTINGNQTIDLDTNPGNSYVLPASTIVHLPDPTPYEGLTITIIFSTDSVLASAVEMKMAYYIASSLSSVSANAMGLQYIHATDALSVLTLQAIDSYGDSTRVNWVVVGQRGILYLRYSATGADAYTILPDGRLIV